MKKIVKFIIPILIIILIAIINRNMTNRAIDDCVKGGNSYYFCTQKLK